MEPPRAQALRLGRPEVLSVHSKNCSLSIDVPHLGPKAQGIPCWKCIKDANSTCFTLDMCLYLAPQIAPQNRYAHFNDTCMLLKRFVQYLRRTRGTIVKDLLRTGVRRLRAYVELSAEYSGNDALVRKTRDTSLGKESSGADNNVNTGVDG